jgi:hypothetical protein
MDWRYEDEYRVLCPLQICEKVSNNLHILAYPEDMIKEVIFGFNCAKHTVDSITESLSDLEVEFYRSIPSSVNYNMEIIKESEFISPEDNEALELESIKNLGLDLSSL